MDRANLRLSDATKKSCDAAVLLMSSYPDPGLSQAETRSGSEGTVTDHPGRTVSPGGSERFTLRGGRSRFYERYLERSVPIRNRHFPGTIHTCQVSLLIQGHRVFQLVIVRQEKRHVEKINRPSWPLCWRPH
jgi:hypothetical protein